MSAHKGFIRGGQQRRRAALKLAFQHIYNTFFSLYSPSSWPFFPPYYPLLFHIGDCLRVTSRSLLAVAFQDSNSLSRMQRYTRERVTLASVGLLWLSPASPPPLSHSLTLFLSLSFCVSTILGRALGGISSGEDATFRINRPVELKPVRIPEWRILQRARFHPRRDGINA